MIGFVSTHVLLRGFLVGWGVLTVLQQTTRGRAIVRRIDSLGSFVPIWTFFAPQPAGADYEVLFRTFREGGYSTEWKVLPFFDERRWWHTALHFNRRAEKTVFDACQELQLAAKSDLAIEEIQLLPPYLIVLNYVHSILLDQRGVHGVQFMIATNPGYETVTADPELLFKSAVHGI